ncbi:MAG TPA: hypothetical protein VD973_02250 [Symbiobacteriaceae bacterium]|nr:hypothetical protein [Symbiobacteriaceae bacterium]
MTGTILVLNGTSSSGKTTLLKAFQNLMDEPYVDAGLDKFLFMLPKRFLNDAGYWQQVMEPTRSGPIGLQLIAGMHRSIAALAATGNHVVADHVLIDPRWLRDCAEVMAPLPAYLIGVRCPLAVVEQRERDRKDRTLGQARQQYDLVHAHGIYDFEVDTSAAGPDEAARALQAFLARKPRPRAFAALCGGAKTD